MTFMGATFDLRGGGAHRTHPLRSALGNLLGLALTKGRLATCPLGAGGAQQCGCHRPGIRAAAERLELHEKPRIRSLRLPILHPTAFADVGRFGTSSLMGGVCAHG